jgi:signal transduction histidine kinase
MLHIAKLDAGEFELCKSTLAIDELIENSVSRFEEQAEREGKALRCEIEKTANAIDVDLSVFKEVMTHLLSNAFKYTAQGATIIVRATLCDRNLIVEVADTGCGVAEDCLPKLSEAFYQADGALNRQYEGAGLGLYVVKRFVELHDGRLEFESKAGQGFLARMEFCNVTCIAKESAAA